MAYGNGIGMICRLSSWFLTQFMDFNAWELWNAHISWKLWLIMSKFSGKKLLVVFVDVGQFLMIFRPTFIEVKALSYRSLANLNNFHFQILEKFKQQLISI